MVINLCFSYIFFNSNYSIMGFPPLSSTDIDECVLIDDACKGGLQCINHFGGYLCLPKSAIIYISQDSDQPTVSDPVPPGTGVGTNPIARVFSSSEMMSKATRHIRCASGFTVDEQNLCRGKLSTSCSQFSHQMMHSIYSSEEC